MIEHYAQLFAQLLRDHPSMGGLMVFGIAFLESLPVVGTIVPGSVTMTAIGILVGMAVMPLGPTLLLATLGAFCGDIIGYVAGHYYNVRLRNMWPFKTRPQWLEAGEKFFHKHGGKSIVIGRFVGPLRSIIPLIAGLLHMPWLRFIIAALPSAGMWAVLYMFPGFLIGALSQQLPPKVATKFALLLLGLIILVSVFAWLFKLICSKFMNGAHRLMKHSWDYLRSNEKFNFLTQSIANKDHPENYHQLTWFVLAILFCLVFSVLFYGVVQENSLVSWNRPAFELLRSLRHIYSDRFFVAITLLGDGRVLTLSGLMIFAWIYLRKRHRDAYYWLGAMAISIIAPLVIKNFTYFPRPSGLLQTSTTSSFPSGHTFYAMMYYGFLAILIATHIPVKYRRYPYTIAATIITLIMVSRVYLGAHWLTDVIASVFLGYTFLAVLTLFYRRKIVPIPVKKLTMFATVITLLVWALYGTMSFQKNMKRYSLLWPSNTVMEVTWWGKENSPLPTYRPNRLGKPAEPMNIQYGGDILQLKTLLLSQGWQSQELNFLKSTLQKLTQAQGNTTSIFPTLYLNNPPALHLTKTRGNTTFVITLWDSNVYLEHSFDQLYIGNIVTYQVIPNQKITTYSYNDTLQLQPYLNRPRWRTHNVTTTHIPHNLQKKKWKGQILQISAPSYY